MIERRDLLKMGAAASLAAGLSNPALARPAGAALWVRDSRFGLTSGALASALAEAVTDGDVTPLWTGSLDEAWRRRGFTVAGATGSDALFVLEHLAWSRGRRVTRREQIAPARDGLPALIRWAIEPAHRSQMADS